MAGAALTLLRPAGAVYGGLMRARAALYRAGWLPVARVAVPVICVGNLTTGGTGKSPMVEHVVRILATAGVKAGIASRGYRRRTRAADVVTVSDGDGRIASPDTGGDEPVMLARALPQVPVVVCANRHAAAARLVNEFQCAAVVLDDGFQHLALHRDLDIVLIDASANLAAEPLLPAGHRREPLAALARAGAIIHTRADGAFLGANRATACRYAPAAAQFTARFVGDGFVSATGERLPMNSLAGRKVLAFCGLARPKPFFEALRQAGCEVVAHACPDHEPYPPSLLGQLAAKAREAACFAAVTTAKDAVKLPADGFSPGLPLFVLVQRVEMDDDSAFRRFVLGVARRGPA
ncbi:MAG: tetraacyldisaccharide 4'-kinase [Candidatus Sumerlaeaceae bacterium]|nr:tetraacyldisaccharide 4'-kinase [Candidatus Sumerlaeaceae bacterium]